MVFGHESSQFAHWILISLIIVEAKSSMPVIKRLLSFPVFCEFDYHGVDIDPVAIEAARRRFHDRPNMHFIAADLCARPFPPDEFDEILFACTSHHLDDERLLCLLKELHYCLKPVGLIHVFDL